MAFGYIPQRWRTLEFEFEFSKHVNGNATNKNEWRKNHVLVAKTTDEQSTKLILFPFSIETMEKEYL